MNIAFLILFLASSVLIVIRSPSAFLPALLEGAQNALALGVTLAAVYTVWMGFLKIAEDAGITRGMARGLKPLTSRLFGTKKEDALGKIAVNLSANMLGMGGAATPAGVSAMRLLGEEKGSGYSQAMLFVVNCVSIQILPTTVVSLREKYGSASSYDVILPVLIASAASLLFAVLLVRLFYGRKK
ncbi:MAG TPA: hypothetical protein H9728_00745 [Candidatus Borkfalkia excrementavium]|uniref:Spore maturation protein n=1 Tax=Candidatus Borkfalkia excrementavium TaxID=2838505 RepID=A0A9D2CFK8_9FIRM|nr:hypothetical protein [Candidatus Borkfalkia excrementavium]